VSGIAKLWARIARISAGVQTVFLQTKLNALHVLAKSVACGWRVGFLTSEASNWMQNSHHSKAYCNTNMVIGSTELWVPPTVSNGGQSGTFEYVAQQDYGSYGTDMYSSGDN
jgi:hypothetical protein